MRLQQQQQKIKYSKWVDKMEQVQGNKGVI